VSITSALLRREGAPLHCHRAPLSLQRGGHCHALRAQFYFEYADPDAADAALASCIIWWRVRSATEQVEELTSARTELAASVEQLSADKERLVPQLEQARWQARQQEKRAEEASAARALAEQVRPVQTGGMQCEAWVAG
jgi:phage shock protein A